MRPGQNDYYSKKDTTITNYIPVDAHYQGATVGNSINSDSLLKAFAVLLEKSKGNGTRPVNIDSVLNAFKMGFKTNLHDTVVTTDPNTKVQLKYWVDEFGKLQMTCTSKDQTIQMMVAQITKLTEELKSNHTTVVVKEMPWWGWLLAGGALLIILFAIVTFIIYNATGRL